MIDSDTGAWTNKDMKVQTAIDKKANDPSKLAKALEREKDLADEARIRGTDNEIGGFGIVLLIFLLLLLL